MVEKSKTKQTLEIEAATEKEENLIKHGFGSKSVSRVSPELYMSNPTEGCEPKKRKFSFEIMFQNRKKAAEEEKAKIKVCKFRNISQFKQVYVVSSSNSGIKSYDATVCNFPTCTCEDFRKNGQKVFCKHILFIMLNVLNSGEFLKSHLDQFILNSSLQTIFSSSSKAVPHLYIQERQLHPRSFSEILKEHPEFQNKQIWKLHIKENRSANCSSVSSKEKISKGDE